MSGAVPAFRAFFAFRPERGAENQPTNPDTMLRPYIPDTNTFYSADPRSVRVCAPSFARTGTPAVDNNPASKALESGNGGLFPEVGAEHLNSSRRSCVTCFFSAVPHPFFHSYFKRSTNHLGQGPSDETLLNRLRFPAAIRKFPNTQYDDGRGSLFETLNRFLCNLLSPSVFWVAAAKAAVRRCISNPS